MRTIKNTFTEFITLGYYPGIRQKTMKDIALKMYMINRVSGQGWNIISFYNGSSIYIPWEWVDLFNSLNTWGGHMIKDPKDRIEQTIYDFLNLEITLGRDNQKFLEVLFRVCKNKTTDFRDWCKQEFKLRLSPIEFNTLDKYSEI